MMHMVGQGVARSRHRALHYFDAGCALGNAAACNNSGLVLRRGGDGVEPDAAAALAKFLESCAGAFRNGCFNASTLYLQGAPGVPRDMPKAIRALPLARTHA